MEPSSILAIKLEIDEEPLTKFSYNDKYKKKDSNQSWSSYTWNCCHCLVVFDSIGELRSHSKEQHNLCNALSCADCSCVFDTFKDFVEHARRHRDVLRNHCEYCNESFRDNADCLNHVTVHYIGTQKICDLCGEMLPYPSTLEWHKQLYESKSAVLSPEGKSWNDYEWMCQECNSKFPDVKSLRTHVQAEHDCCFAFRCADCAIKSNTFKQFVSHVVVHRPYLRSYCQYCNAYFKSFKEMNQHIVQHITSQQRPCNHCGQIFNDNILLARHKKIYSDNSFKRINKKHKKRVRKKTEMEAVTVVDLTCTLCGKLFESVNKLKRHEETHGNRRRDFICSTCGRAFLTKGAMQDHALTHTQKTEVCKVCNKKFHTVWKLKSHLVTHSTVKPFSCDECGANFKTKKRLNSHMKKHSDVKPFKCPYCAKEFRFKENLKTHERQHTGARPYSCEFCDRTFTNWTNCNKHMLRKHGMTLARTKITEQGRLTINRSTGEVNKLNSDSNTEHWLNEMLKPKRKKDTE